MDEDVVHESGGPRAGPGDTMSDCICMNPVFRYPDFDRIEIGVDETKGRFGEVSIHVCRTCGRKWLHYYVTYEGFSQSGRWYRGLVSDETAGAVTPETAVNVLEGLEWHFYGGSYFGMAGQEGRGPILVNL
jgi:hypothetical protein